MVYAELARIADIDEKTTKTWLSLLVSSYIVKIVEPYANDLLKRPSKQPVMHFLDTGLAAYLTGWTSPQALEAGAMSGQFFETHVLKRSTRGSSTPGNARRSTSSATTTRRKSIY